jgi:beta-lactam-binding protein with PASTA domain
MKLKSLFWTIPFISFLLGYLLFKFIFSINNKIVVPTVVGLQLKDAVKILSDTNLNIKIITEKEDDDLPDGTIIAQTPFNTEVKPLQSVYLTTSKKPKKRFAPNFVKKNINEINKIAQKEEIKIKKYFLPSNQKEDICIIQSPKDGELLKDDRITLYISSTNNKKVIFPDLRDLSLQNALDFLNLYSIKPTITKENEDQKDKIIIDQRPLAGSIVDLEKVTVQLKI